MFNSDEFTKLVEAPVTHVDYQPLTLPVAIPLRLTVLQPTTSELADVPALIAVAATVVPSSAVSCAVEIGGSGPARPTDGGQFLEPDSEGWIEPRFRHIEIAPNGSAIIEVLVP